ncbi:hypothetical protein VPFG_00222 [Vibrio phage nt-1]|uniref:Uncharacterized protein n=1 Tax=Vibrio phage nt-1 TaxID=115992 RepID=R9TJF0_9CAUD|nr:hypothetical protein VPFG_00222 [Vibrio phage nt-1]AGN30222.1 hypothetical protein VPFG_00222 [Vibrio phage nt-1]
MTVIILFQMSIFALLLMILVNDNNKFLADGVKEILLVSAITICLINAFFISQYASMYNMLMENL